MIASMTGFAAESRDFEFGTVAIEVRSVNHRYLDVQFRMTDELRAVEPAMREMIGARLTRGKVDCRVSISHAAASAPELMLNVAMVAQLRRLQARVQARFDGLHPLGVADILRWPGVLESHDVDPERLRAIAIDLLGHTLESFQQSRRREGDKLKAALLERVAGMEATADQVAPLVPELLRSFEERLATRLTQALGNHDDDRLRQEVILFAGKVDIDEELTRLRTHLAEVRRVLDAGGPCGKRLDFLMQELNREANTMGSKSALAEVSRMAVDLKVLIEQMREQVQNIE